MAHVSSFSLFLCQSDAHTYANQNVLAETLFSKKCIVYITLTMTMFVRSQSFISLPSFMFVGAAVSEIRESNRNENKKENLQNGYFQLNTFSGHIIDPFFHQSYSTGGKLEVLQRRYQQLGKLSSDELCEDEFLDKKLEKGEIVK